MTRNVTVEMSGFSRESVREQASRQQIPVAALLRHAVLHYLAETNSGRLAPKLPRFLRDAPIRGDEQLDVEVDLEDADWAAFEAAAHETGVSLSQLLGHAALLYLADLDSGIVARRLVDGED